MLKKANFLKMKFKIIYLTFIAFSSQIFRFEGVSLIDNNKYSNSVNIYLNMISSKESLRILMTKEGRKLEVN